MLIDIATASPPYKVTQSKAAEELKKRMKITPVQSRLIDTAAHYSGIDTRYIVVPDAEETASDLFYTNKVDDLPGTKKRMDEYEKWTKILSCNAAGKLFKETNFNPKKINRIITISCTGFFAPGLDYYIMKEFNIPPAAKRTNIGFMGCAASLIGFNSVLEALRPAEVNGEINALLISVELCSLHLHLEPTRDNILANTLFADGCAVVLFSNSKEYKPKLDLLETRSITFDNSVEFMGWKIGDTGFEMILSPELPKMILEHAAPALINILKDIGIEKESIKHWALHPGGRAILDALQVGLNLSDEQVLPSRTILKNFGNMSSASILYVLKELLNASAIKKDEFCCAVAFGPGLSMEVAILKGA